MVSLIFFFISVTGWWRCLLLMRKYMNCTYEIKIYKHRHFPSFPIEWFEWLSWESSYSTYIKQTFTSAAVCLCVCLCGRIDPSLTVSRIESHVNPQDHPLCVTLNFSLSLRWCRHVIFMWICLIKKHCVTCKLVIIQYIT